MASTARAGDFPAPQHDHAACRTGAFARAERVCRAAGARLTSARRRVLEAVWESHSPVGAYDIAERLSGPGRRMAPVTVYRALDFLMDMGLVHRLASLNAFVGCGRSDPDHRAAFLICDGCGAVAELDGGPIDAAMAEGAERAGFRIEAAVVEARGRCPGCRSGRVEPGSGPHG